MFESLTDRFDAVFSRLRGRGRLSEADVDEALREIRLALLQADVNLRVVRDFVSRVREQLVGIGPLAEPHPRPAGRQGRPRRAANHPGRRGPPADLRVPAADRHSSRRSAGIGQDHHGRQAGLPGTSGGRVATRCSSGPTCSARPPWSSSGSSASRPGSRSSASRPIRSRWPRRVWRRPSASGATCSSSTPPAGCRSTPS